ncbi:leucine-rich repeat-containing protein 56 [Discoglossus pictus]
MSNMDRTKDSRPGTASVRVTDCEWQGLLNPSPLNKEEDGGLVDEYLSPAKLQALTGVDDLTTVKALQMCVDTRENSLGNFGIYMPNLRQLKLNNSLILSVRDLGTSLSHVQVLWMARCGLSDLDGISSLCSLKELYLAYNDLNDLSQVSMLENLEILDLEGNNLDNINELQYLALCSKLTTLSLEGNAICIKPNPEATESPEYNYRAEVHRLIPHLRVLDDVLANQLHTDTPRTPTHDWLMVKDYIKDIVGDQVGTGLGSGNVQRKLSPRPSTAQFTLSGRPRSMVRPASAGRPSTSYQGALGSPQADPFNAEEGNPEDEASDLTHGVGRVICGNPIKALRARKEKLVPSSMVTSLPGGHRPEHSYDLNASSDKDRDDVFAELRAWREKHNELLQRIQEDRAPQILTIAHTDDGDGQSVYSSSEEDGLKESWDLECLGKMSPETPCPSPTHQSPAGFVNPGRESTDTSWVPSPPMTPCPPASGSGNLSPSKGADLRTRRLLRGLQSGTVTTKQVTAGPSIRDEIYSPSGVDGDHSWTHGTEGRDLSGRPFSEPIRIRRVNVRSPVDRNTPKLIPSHQPVIRSSTKTPERPTPPHTGRPITARGILQRLPNRPTRLTSNKMPNT